MTRGKVILLTLTVYIFTKDVHMPGLTESGRMETELELLSA